MVYVGYLIIMNGQNIKTLVLKISIFELLRVENCRSRLCAPAPCPHPNTQIG